MISLERVYISGFKIPNIMLIKTVKFKLSFSREETALVNYVTLNDKDRLTNFMIKYGWANSISFIKSYTNSKFKFWKQSFQQQNNWVKDTFSFDFSHKSTLSSTWDVQQLFEELSHS